MTVVQKCEQGDAHHSRAGGINVASVYLMLLFLFQLGYH